MFIFPLYTIKRSPNIIYNFITVPLTFLQITLQLVGYMAVKMLNVFELMSIF